MPKKYIERILKARVYDVAHETPLEEARGLSERLRNQVLVKREDLQPVHSFKLRGAYNKMASLSQDELDRGVIAASAGNHAQGVALSARQMGVKATIVMPKTTPEIKVQSVRKYGGKTVLHGDAYDDAYRHAQELSEQRGMTLVHPYDDPEVIAGQGTIAMEILRQHSGKIDAIFIPVGGGGLIAGMAAYIKYLYPEIRVIGVEPEDAPTLHDALEKKRRVVLKQVGIFADGVAVRQIGKETYRLCKQLVDEVVLVSSDEICAAIKDLFDDTRSIAEPAGALSIAGLKKYVEQRGVEGQTLVAVDSGANINFDRLRHVAERAELGERKEAVLGVTIPERPGSFKRFCRLLGKRQITEFNYRFADKRDAHIFVGIQLSDGEERAELVQRLRDKGYPVEDLSDNEVAKVHVRYMVGGHQQGVENEILYRFRFPERPGALLQFLTRLGRNWNISLFHYRNHGAAYGRVLCGIQVPKDERGEYQQFLDDLGYHYEEETDNPAYKLFLN